MKIVQEVFEARGRGDDEDGSRVAGHVQRVNERPGPASVLSLAERTTIKPASTYMASSSRVWICGGAPLPVRDSISVKALPVDSREPFTSGVDAGHVFVGVGGRRAWVALRDESTISVERPRSSADRAAAFEAVCRAFESRRGRRLSLRAFRGDIGLTLGS